MEKFWGMGWQKNFGGDMAKYFEVGGKNNFGCVGHIFFGWGCKISLGVGVTAILGGWHGIIFWLGW